MTNNKEASAPAVVHNFVRVTLTDVDVAPLIEKAGATLRPHRTPERLALALAFYEGFLATHPLAMEPDLSRLVRLEGRQRSELERLRRCLEGASRIFSSTEKDKRAAGIRWLHSVDKLREIDGHTFIPVRDMAKHLAALSLAATQALTNPNSFLKHYILLGVRDPQRVLDELGRAKIAEMVEDARSIMSREPKTRVLIFIGRAIEEHIEGSLLGTVDPDTGLPSGPALALGRAIAAAWGIEPVPDEDALRSTWKRMPERLAGHPAKSATKRGRGRR